MSEPDPSEERSGIITAAVLGLVLGLFSIAIIYRNWPCGDEIETPEPPTVQTTDEPTQVLPTANREERSLVVK